MGKIVNRARVVLLIGTLALEFAERVASFVANTVKKARQSRRERREHDAGTDKANNRNSDG